MSKELQKYDVSKLLVFDMSDAHNIEYIARGLTSGEVLDYFGLDENDLNVEDKKFFSYHFRVGRAKAKSEAIEAFFTNMKQKGGTQAALSYLIRFGDAFLKDEEADTELKGKRSFTITLDKGD